MHNYWGGASFFRFGPRLQIKAAHVCSNVRGLIVFRFWPRLQIKAARVFPIFGA